jgi:hypothetical protein
MKARGFESDKLPFQQFSTCPSKTAADAFVRKLTPSSKGKSLSATSALQPLA